MAYLVGGVGMLVVTAVAWGGLVEPAESKEVLEKKKM